MAKQIGAMPISGKIDNLVYYNTKNGGAVVRMAYPNLGKRVKTDKVYANTRRNNAEFGMCGFVASQLLSPILQRWKYILKPDAVGELTKANFERLKLDTQNPWGQRNLSQLSVGFQRFEELTINSLSKNEAPSGIKNLFESDAIEYHSEGDYHYIFIDEATIADEQETAIWINMGCTSINVYFGGISIALDTFNAVPNLRNFTPAKSYIGSKYTYPLQLGEIVEIPPGFETGIPDYVRIVADDTTDFGSVIILVVPVKNGEELVEAGSYYLKGLPVQS